MLTISLLIISLLSCEWWELLALAAAVLMHELGHFFALRICGIPLQSIRLGMTGAVINGQASTSLGEEIIVALFGSVFGFLWAFLLSLTPLPHGRYAAEVSIILSLFNLLPVPFLDGGQIFCALGGNEKTLRICGLCCMVILLVLCVRLHLWYSCPALLWIGMECLRKDRDHSCKSSRRADRAFFSNRDT